MKRLGHDSRGAILVMGLFMALISAGALYYLVGVAEAIVVKQRMQDAADATAYSSAVIQARGMNILVLFNMIMALLIALLMLFKMLIQILLVAKAFALGLAWLMPGLLAAVPPLANAEAQLRRVEPEVEEVVDRGLRSMDRLSDAARRAVPAVALSKSITLAREHYGEVAQAGVSFPLYESLPVQDGEYKTLCLKAGHYVAGAGERVLAYLDITNGKITGFVSKLVGKAVRQYSKLFCGEGGSFERTYEQTFTLPNLAQADLDRCEVEADPVACDRAQAYMDDFRRSFQESTGACAAVEGESGSADQIRATCEGHLAAAREVCHPASDGGGVARKGWDKWRVRYERVEHVYGLRKGASGAHEVVHLRAEPVAHKVSFTKGEYIGLKRLDEIDAPADRRTPCPQSWTLWERDPRKPLCGERVREPRITDFSSPDDTVRIRQDRISDVLFCREKRVEKVPFDVEASQSDVTFEEACDCAHLGEERFQVRALVVGNSEDFLRRTRKSIRVADLIGAYESGEDGPLEAVVRTSEYLGRGAIAQAEIYFGKAGVSRADWMWSMTWRARLRRVSLEDIGDGSCAESAARDAPRTCTAMYGLESLLSRAGVSGADSPLHDDQGGHAGAIERFLGALDGALVH